MATYKELYDLYAQGSGLRNQATIAILKAAGDIMNESPATSNHANRLVWAKRVLVSPGDEAAKFMWPLLANATVAATALNANDNDVQFVVNSYIDTFANAGA